MREFQDKRRRRRMIYSLPVRLGLTLIIIALAGSIFRLYKKERQVGLERAILLEEVERLRARQRELAAEVEKLTTARGVEEEIREKFNVVKPGEKVISLVTSQTAPTSSSFLPPTSWWQKVMNWFR
ncbi:MAG: septum formation initiator family protein [Candidatus Vogelbacteria bacterium]|nr:septum formation initiator family protein [Candidatus Vogelbacteria bacterium]